MTIQPHLIERDHFGHWTHPELPEWDEGTPKTEIDAWFKAQGLQPAMIWLEHGNDEQAYDKYFDDGDPDLSDWNPAPPLDGAFLLSIHDTESGPVALWAVRPEQLSPCHVE